MIIFLFPMALHCECLGVAIMFFLLCLFVIVNIVTIPNTVMICRPVVFVHNGSASNHFESSVKNVNKTNLRRLRPVSTLSTNCTK